MPQRQFSLGITEQPDVSSCGPTCLNAVYGYFGDAISLEQTIEEVESLDEGGTLDVFLACHALARGYRATIYTYNLSVFDPTWFSGDVDLHEKLAQQAKHKHSRKLQRATSGYRRYLKLGGEIRMTDLTGRLLRSYLRRDIPVLCGLSATWLYRGMRERPHDCEEDDVCGEPAGHFVVLCGYDRGQRDVRVADPYLPNPITGDHYYNVGLDRLIDAILLGAVTYDANLLIIQPRS